MCEQLDVSRSGYYDWKDRPLSKREGKHEEIVRIIKKIHKKYPVWGVSRSVKKFTEELTSVYAAKAS